MNETTLSLEVICGSNIYTRDDGRILFNRIEQALEKGDKVIVEFNDKEIASESFLDEAIVEHYLRPQSPDVAERLILRHVAKPDQMLLGMILTYRRRLEKKEEKKRKNRRECGDSRIT